MKTLPSTGFLDLLRLAGGLLRAFLRRPSAPDTSQALSNWMKGVTRRTSSENVILNFLVKKVLLVTGRDLSRHILAERPRGDGYAAGALKRKAMTFLAPRGLTILQDELWERQRPFHENVLCAGRPHEHEQAFLLQVHRAFAAPVGGIADIRKAMGQVMRGVVFGEGVAPERVSEDVQVLFDLVQSPLKRVLRGGKEKGRRKRFYDDLRTLWRGAEGEGGKRPALLSRARRFVPAEADEGEMLEQIPHWMFTFTQSGADLLARTLALVASRPAVRARVIEEIRANGPLDQAASVARWKYLEACLWEAGRVFPPVTKTTHDAPPKGDVFDGAQIPPGIEIAHYFPTMQRDVAGDPTSNDFQPERWLGEGGYGDPHAATNLFLSGARVCPGQDLIRFVCKAAIALLLARHDLQVEGGALSRAPLPFSFPEKQIRFRAGGETR